MAMQCTRAAKPGVFERTVTRRGPVMLDIFWQNETNR